MEILLWKYFLEIFWDLRKVYLTIISDQSGCAVNTDENISDRPSLFHFSIEEGTGMR